MFLDSIPVFGSERFANFQSAEDRVDTLFFECMVGNESYKSLFSVVKLILILSHGQATVERGFSVNKEVEVENLKEHTLVGQRIVCDHVNSVGGVLKVDLSKPLLLSVNDNGTRNTLIKKGRRKKLNRNGQKESVCWKRLKKSKRRRRELMLK